MKKILFIVIVLFFEGVSATAQPGYIYTIAGTGVPGYSGDGGPATDAKLHRLQGIVTDDAGNIYVSDANHNVIRKVNAAGIISTIAGTDTMGYAGDGNPATTARMKVPTGMVIDAAGNLYVAEQTNQVVRKIDASGIISTYAGNGATGFSGDGGLAVSASLKQPKWLTKDGAGNIYIGGVVTSAVRKVNTSWIISTIAGIDIIGFTGDGGMATNAKLTVSGLVSDAAGNIYAADMPNNRIRKIGTDGIIRTIAGNGTASNTGDGGAASAATLYQPMAMAADAWGNVFVACGQVVRRIDITGTITTVAGSDSAGYTGDGGPATNARITPSALAVDGSGNLYIADMIRGVVRKVISPYLGLKESSETAGPSVFPNPNRGVFTVRTGSGIAEGEVTIRVVDMAGKIVHKQQANVKNSSDLLPIEPSEPLTPGLYLLQVFTQKETVTAPFSVVQ